MESLKIEAGKYYRTRGGDKAWMGCDIRTGGYGGIYPFIGVVGGYRQSWASDGSSIYGEQSPFDIIAEWKEPKRIKGWVNIWDRMHEDLRGVAAEEGNAFPGTNVYLSKDDADRAAKNAANWSDSNRIACIFVDVLEGEGLDGSAR